MTSQRTDDGRIRVPADLDAVTAVGGGRPFRHRSGGRRADLAGGAALVCGGHAPRHPAVPAPQREGGPQPRDRARLGERARGPAGRRKGAGHQRIRRSARSRRPRRSRRPSCTCWSSAGRFSLDDRVCEYLPTYTSHGKDRTTIRHVMTHSAGVPFATGPRPDLEPDGRHRVRPPEARRTEADSPARPGAHLPRRDVGPAGARDRLGRHRKNIREILATEILDPLGFRWTNFGVAEAGRPAGGAESHHR